MLGIVIREWLGDVTITSAYASLPPFNRQHPEHIFPSIAVDEKCFEPAVQELLIGLFDNDSVRLTAGMYNITLPEVTLSSFIQGKMCKVEKLVEISRNICKARQDIEATDKLNAFVKAFSALTKDDIRSKNDWDSFLSKHMSHGWENRLNVNCILENFGFSTEASAQLCEYMVDDDGKEKTLSRYSIRWLSKIFTAYGPEGCLTDVANLLSAMWSVNADSCTTNLVKIATEMTSIIETCSHTFGTHDHFLLLWRFTHVFPCL